jgi:alkylhydroperoxidase family enzyme
MTDTAAPSSDALTDGRSAVLTHAPKAAASLARLEQTVWRAVDPDLVDLAARMCAQVHGYQALARPASLGASPWAGRDASQWRSFDELRDSDRVALAFAEQFTADVSAMSDAQRDELVEAFGDAALTFAHAMYVIDVTPRAHVALDRLFGPSADAAPVRPTEDVDTDLWAAIQHNVRTVPGLDALDPVTSELIRLRCARQHNCRICQSLRSHSAFVAGADESTFDAVDFYESSDLSEAVKAALALTDAMVWTPGHIPAEVIDAVRAHFTPAQQVELVLDIARHATNKFAVSMAVDTPNVSEGFEVYLVAPDGSTTYGLERP